MESIYKSLFICLGSNQLDTILKIIQDKKSSFTINATLIIYWKGASLRQLNLVKQSALKSRCFDHIHVEYYYMDPGYIRQLNQPHLFEAWSLIIKNRLKTNSFDELISPKLFHPPEKALMEAYPDSKIRLFDEGLRCRIDQPIYRSKNYFKRIVGRGVCKSHLSRVQSAYYITTTGAIPNYIKQISDFRFALGASPLHSSQTIKYLVDSTLVRKPCKSTTNICLLLTQNLHFAGFCDDETEIQLYADICKFLVQLGYAPAVKFHPRDGDEFRRKFFSVVDCITPKFDDSLDLVTNILNIQPCAIVGILSTALFECKDYSIAPTYTAGSSLAFKLASIRTILRFASLWCIYPISFLPPYK